jgi:hypothetical protein
MSDQQLALNVLSFACAITLITVLAAFFLIRYLARIQYRPAIFTLNIGDKPASDICNKHRMRENLASLSPVVSRLWNGHPKFSDFCREWHSVGTSDANGAYPVK